MRAQMAHFQAKIGVFGTLDHQKLIYLTSSVYILILLIKSFHQVQTCLSKILSSHFLIPK